MSLPKIEGISFRLFLFFLTLAIFLLLVFNFRYQPVLSAQNSSVTHSLGHVLKKLISQAPTSLSATSLQTSGARNLVNAYNSNRDSTINRLMVDLHEARVAIDTIQDEDVQSIIKEIDQMASDFSDALDEGKDKLEIVKKVTELTKDRIQKKIERLDTDIAQLQKELNQKNKELQGPKISNSKKRQLRADKGRIQKELQKIKIKKNGYVKSMKYLSRVIRVVGFIARFIGHLNLAFTVLDLSYQIWTLCRELEHELPENDTETPPRVNDEGEYVSEYINKLEDQGWKIFKAQEYKTTGSFCSLVIKGNSLVFLLDDEPIREFDLREIEGFRLNSEKFLELTFSECLGGKKYKLKFVDKDNREHLLVENEYNNWTFLENEANSY